MVVAKRASVNCRGAHPSILNTWSALRSFAIAYENQPTILQNSALVRLTLDMSAAAFVTVESKRQCKTMISNWANRPSSSMAQASFHPRNAGKQVAQQWMQRNSQGDGGVLGQSSPGLVSGIVRHFGGWPTSCPHTTQPSANAGKARPPAHGKPC